MIRLRKDISFFSKARLKLIFENIPQNASVIIDLTKAEFIDKDIIDTINEFKTNAITKNITISIKKSLYNESHKLVEKKVENKSDDRAH